MISILCFGKKWPASFVVGFRVAFVGLNYKNSFKSFKIAIMLFTLFPRYVFNVIPFWKDELRNGINCSLKCYISTKFNFIVLIGSL